MFLSGECHGQRSLAGYTPWGRKASDMTERLNHHREFLGDLLPFPQDILVQATSVVRNGGGAELWVRESAGLALAGGDGLGWAESDLARPVSCL